MTGVDLARRRVGECPFPGRMLHPVKEPSQLAL
jgi:hypothetical protein